MWGKQRLDWEYILSSDNVPTPVPVICSTQAPTQSLHSLRIPYSNDCFYSSNSSPWHACSAFFKLTNDKIPLFWQIFLPTISTFLSFANYPIFSCKQISTDYRHLFVEATVVRALAYLSWYVWCKIANHFKFKWNCDESSSFHDNHIDVCFDITSV